MVQRNGRVVTLKSPHAEVYLTTMLPEPGDLGPAQRFAIDLLRDPSVTLPAGAAAAEEALSRPKLHSPSALSGIR